MKFKFKRIIELETEFEMPLLGFDVQWVFTENNNKEIKEALIQSIKSGQLNQTIKKENNTYTITIKDTLHGK